MESYPPKDVAEEGLGIIYLPLFIRVANVDAEAGTTAVECQGWETFQIFTVLSEEVHWFSTVALLIKFC